MSWQTRQTRTSSPSPSPSIAPSSPFQPERCPIHRPLGTGLAPDTMLSGTGRSVGARPMSRLSSLLHSCHRQEQPSSQETLATWQADVGIQMPLLVAFDKMFAPQPSCLVFLGKIHALIRHHGTSAVPCHHSEAPQPTSGLLRAILPCGPWCRHESNSFILSRLAG